jgi:threonine dehydrogenase-like Zn-dependent dehydrogenase
MRLFPGLACRNQLERRAIMICWSRPCRRASSAASPTPARASENAREIVERLTQGRRCATVVEATGLPAVAAKAAELAGKLGEVIFLGSPRGEHLGDITAVPNQVHLWGNGCVTFKGAHERCYPVKRDPNG